MPEHGQAPRALATGLLAVVLLVGACSSDDEASNPDDSSTVDGSGEGEPVGLDAGWVDSAPALGPLVSGTSSMVEGTFVWTDHAYDDRGANAGPGDRTVLDDAGGDAGYPDGLTNAADLIQLQLSASSGEDGESTDVAVLLETLTDPGVPAVVVGLDTDADPSTGADALPGLSWEPDEPLGLELALLLAEDAGQVAVAEDDAWSEAATPAVEVDAEENLLQMTVDEQLLPRDGTWRVVTATGLAAELSDLTADESTATAYDLTVGGEEPYQWQDYVQADVLAGLAPAEEAVLSVESDQLGTDATDVEQGREPGFHTYLYRSELALAEGTASTPEGLELLGPYQPYLVWIGDDGARADEPLTVFLHGSQQNHLGSVMPGGAYLGTARPLSDEVHQLAQYAVDGVDFPPHTTTVWPLARGEGLGYQGIAEQDVLDVLADAEARLAPDPDRIILTGASMGGIGAFRLGARHPDRWSAVAPIIGFAPDETEPLLENLTGVPIRQINGAVDPLIDAAEAEATTDLLDELELDFRAWMLDDRGHEAGGFVYDCVYEGLPELERDPSPPQVTYTVDPSLFEVDPETGLDLTYDGAWWVSDIEPAGGEAATVTATSRARQDVDLEAVHVDRRGESGPEGADLCGPDPDVSTGDTWRERAVVLEVAEEREPSDQVELVLVEVAAVTVDLEAAGVTSGDDAVVQVSADGNAEVVLAGLAPGQAVEADGEVVEADEDGTVTVAVDEGDTTITVDAA